MGQRINDLEGYIKEAIANIRDDRDITSTLLTDIFYEIKKSKDPAVHKDLGFIASKYVETLQRSNEQLVKITSILSKKQENTTSLDDSDKRELFNIIQGDKS